METSVKAYGKILVFGAYSILEPGNIGLVVNIDRGTTTTVTETKTARVVIDLSTFEIEVYGYVENQKLKLNNESEILVYIKNAVQSSFDYLNHKSIKVRDIKLISYNDPELYIDKKIKTGFGSSATSIVSGVAAILNLHGIDDPNLVYKIARYAHYKSQGSGSGFDISSACFGSHYFISKNSTPGDDLIKYINIDLIENKQGFDWPNYFVPLIIFTGKSASTKDLVMKLNEYKQKNPDKYEKFMYQYNLINLGVKKAFDNNWLKNIKRFLEESWKMRKKLGELINAPIEPDKFTKLLDSMKENGAYTAGLVGAGGGDSILALCENEDKRKELIQFCRSKRLTVLDNLNIVNKGYEIV